MKDCQKRWQPNNTENVVATLMSRDEMRPQQPFCGKRRVLSDSYIRKAASIGLRQGSFVTSGHSCSKIKEIVNEMKDVSGGQISELKNDNVLEKGVNSRTTNVETGIRSRKLDDASVSKSLSRVSYRDRRSFGEKREHCASRNVLISLQKLKRDSLAGHLGELGIDYSRKSLKFQLEIIDKLRFFSTRISSFKPKSEKVAYDFEDVKLDQHFRSGYREYRDSLRPESGKHHHELPYQELVVSGTLSPRHSCIACSRTMNRISRQEIWRSKFEDASKPGYMGNNHVVNEVEGVVSDVNDCEIDSQERSSLSSESKKQNFARWKITKEVKEVGVSEKRQTLDEMLALANKKSMTRNLNTRLDRNGLGSLSKMQPRSSDSTNPSVFSSIDVPEDDSLKRSPVSEFEVAKVILSSGQNLKQDEESNERDNNFKEQTIFQKAILESNGGRECEQFQASPGVDDSISPNSTTSELSSCYFSGVHAEYNNPEAYVEGIQDQLDKFSENDSCGEVELSQRVSESSINNLAAKDDTYASGEALDKGVCSRINGDPHAESSPGILSGEAGQSSYVQEVLSGEASTNELSGDESAYSNCSRTGPPEFKVNLRRTNQHSPNSVLEPFDVQNSPTCQSLYSIGLSLHLQALNFDSEETYSEGSVMAISGEDDSEVRIHDLSHDGRNVKRWLGDNESRSFSYMVDVLDEAGYSGMKPFMDFKKWDSLEHPISPLVFESLEKKYGKQTSWETSERQLLFDRINSGLVDIFNPVINLNACAVRRRICAALRRDEVEDELWMKLISQEQEKSKDLSEKAIGKWLEYEEGIDIICRELETSLFDELVMELASL